MIRTSFNDGWEVRPKSDTFAEISGDAQPYQAVSLPHDAMIGQQRAPDSASTTKGAAGAYFPGGVYEYRKRFAVPDACAGKRVFLEFEAVYRDASVYVNGAYAGQRPYGYSHFHIDIGRFLRCGQDNEIRVEARCHQDSRWYTGAGIYRDTWMRVGDLVRIGLDTLRVAAPDIDGERAVVEVTAMIENDSVAMRTVDVITELRDASGNLAASNTTRLTVLPGEPAPLRRRMYVQHPALWRPDSPHLYSAKITLKDQELELDVETVTFGIRSLRLDPEHGLRINGEPIKLRGACVHHDNGVLGAATYAASEERRVRILKEAGFNAIRMSHQPMSKAMLDACDRLGMLVVDEAFDMWTVSKSGHDYGVSFPEWWERDIEAMVAKDFNHPSVIIYSIGNEIPEIGLAAGAVWGRKLAEKLRSLDGTRYITNAVNTVLAAMCDMPALAAMMPQARKTIDEGAGVNTLMSSFLAMMGAISASDLVTRNTEESFGVLDIAGMNYAENRYALDHDLFPDRIIMGSETFTTGIGKNWELVKRHDHVIGDFAWTGWDYLGEAGIGRANYQTSVGARPSVLASYPYLLADCGDIDITGHRRPASYYREIVFGLRSRPYIAVLRPEHHGKIFNATPWAWSDTVSTWSWPGREGSAVTVEVYSDADEVELQLDGRTLGRLPAGPEHGFRAEFDTVFEPGELLAIAYREGAETGRHSLRSAQGKVVLRAEAERAVISTAHGDLAYVHFTLTDADGVLYTGVDRPVGLQLSGAGQLIGFGSANPSTEERFDAEERWTHDGRALAVIRPTGRGEIRLRATASGCDQAEIVIVVDQDGR